MDLRANPRIVYVGAFGFSQRGPYAARPAYDDLIQGMSGIPGCRCRRGCPIRVTRLSSWRDRIVGLQVAFAVTAALRHRDDRRRPA